MSDSAGLDTRQFRGDVARDYPDCLRDESRKTGTADSVSFPASEEAIRGDVAAARSLGRCVTIQGARTGITGGAVPAGGHVLNLSRMNRVTGFHHDPASGRVSLSVQPGLTLADLRKGIEAMSFDTTGWTPDSTAALARASAAGRWFLPTDPTETSASIGGMVSCNASGALSFRYGPARRYVESLRLVLADGGTLVLRRGEQKAKGREFAVRTEQGTVVAGRVPRYAMPSVKNAAGYFAADDMDLLDLFVGAEGTLGVVSEVELRLLPRPAAMWGMTAFLPDEESACRFVEAMRGLSASGGARAIEYFDPFALAMLRARKALDSGSMAEVPDVPAGAQHAVYVEFHAAKEDAAAAAAMAAGEELVRCGGDEGLSWLADTDGEMARLKAFRHAVPESVNLLIDQRRREHPGLTKLGTDLSVPDTALRGMLTLYRRDLVGHGLEYVMFGHIGNSHLHVNIVPRDPAEYEIGRRLYLAWAREAVRLGGSVSAEHGIGKLKTALLEAMYGPRGVDEMRRTKAVFDPQWTLNPGNLFPREASVPPF